MKVSIWVDWDNQEVYSSFDAVKEEWKEVCDAEDNCAPTPFHGWLDEHYTCGDVWSMAEDEREVVLKQYNDYCDECFHEWIATYLDEVEINI